MKYFTKEVKIALSGILAIVILFFGIKFLKGINMFKATNYYYVSFENVGGLTQSSPVYADGYNIGIVRNIAYNYQRPGNVIVEIEVDQEFQMPEGSSSELVTEMLGTVKMNLLLNRNTTNRLSKGDTIPGYVNGGLMEEAGRLVPKMAEILPKLDSIVSSLNQLLADPTITRTLYNTERITANLTHTTYQLNQLLDKDIPQLTGNLHTITSDFAHISNNLKSVDYASSFLKLDTTLYNMQLITDKLNRKDNSLGLLLNDPSIYQNLNATSANAAALLEDLKTNPKRYVHFSLFGRKEK